MRCATTTKACISAALQHAEPTLSWWLILGFRSPHEKSMMTLHLFIDGFWVRQCIYAKCAVRTAGRLHAERALLPRAQQRNCGGD